MKQSILSSDYYWHKLWCAKGIGPKTIHKVHQKLKENDSDISDLLSSKEPPGKKKLGLTEKQLMSLGDMDESECMSDYEQLKQKGVHLIHLSDKRYPANVKEHLDDSSPPILYCDGETGLLSSDGIAIVGARRASEKLLSKTGKIASSLAQAGKNILSGYAKGVDTAAHLGALSAGGTTTFVLSYGILEFSRKKVFADTPWTGNILAVSQFYPQSKFHARNAMERNKLVVALSKGVIVIASGPEKNSKGKSSGTFAAGKIALNTGSPLFVLSPTLVGEEFPGNRELIKQGGIEVDMENFTDIIIDHRKKTE